MIKDTKDVRAIVVDRGTFFPIAERLARDMECSYHIPNGDSFETFAKGGLGLGHSNVKLDSDPWLHKSDYDLWVFPDCADAGWQLELQSQGIPVWGSKTADVLEKQRGEWIKACQKMGLPMPKTNEILGIRNLEAFFDKHEGTPFFVKISRWRGDMETWKAIERHQIRNKLDLLRMKFGPFQDKIKFYVQEMIKTDIESGADTYFVGDFPDKIILGYEKKGESYLALWKLKTDMPKEVWNCMVAAKELLKERDYANTVSSEVRIKGKKAWWLDPCFRFPSPAGEEQLELYVNFSDIVWHGANGELVQPIMQSMYCGEAVITYTGDKEGWKSVVVPDDVKEFVKLYACSYDDGAYHFPPHQDPEAIGCAVALGDTPEEVIDGLKAIKEEWEDAPVELHIEPMAELIAEIEKAKEQGIDFGEEPLPDPAEVLDV